MTREHRYSLDAVFSALADPTRRAILERLSWGHATVSEVAKPFDVSLPAISKHLGVLEEAGLVIREKDGRMRHCRLVADPMRDVAQWIGRYRAYWEGQFDALEEFLNQEEERDGRT